MSSFQIKVLAALLMTIDHVGVVFFPHELALRYIGRLSFPLFAWLIGQGEKHTRSFKAYLLKLTTWGIISQPVYYLLFSNLWGLNILVTLGLGLLAIRLGKIFSLKYLAWTMFATIAQLINSSYGAYGVLTVTLLSEFSYTSLSWWSKWFLLNISTFVIPNFPEYQFLASAAPAILILWNSKQGQKLKLFYLFYPVHLGIILALNLIAKAMI